MTDVTGSGNPSDATLTEAGYREEQVNPYNLGQQAVAEFVGTFTLIFIGAGSIIAVGAAGGGNGGAGLVTIAIAHGLAIATMVSAIGHVSGGHLNPAVTIAAAVTRKIRVDHAVGYLVAQLAGAIAAAGILRGALPGSAWRAAKLGTPLLASGFSAGRGVLIEAVLSFLLIWVIFATAVDTEGAFGKIAGLAIGFVVLMDIMMGGPFTGAAMNPARSLGPALVGHYGTKEWVYWVGPIAGGVAAALVYDFTMIRPRSARAARR
jgi:aquaporin Z